ncbi:hypothetical protein TYRP_003545 [Tyrophagus putrescentiae]|nr:hypothetical protein TYRP_003545 [Tyrophagus putrescentiae]
MIFCQWGTPCSGHFFATLVVDQFEVIERQKDEHYGEASSADQRLDRPKGGHCFGEQQGQTKDKAAQDDPFGSEVVRRLARGR